MFSIFYLDFNNKTIFFFLKKLSQFVFKTQIQTFSCLFWKFVPSLSRSPSLALSTALCCYFIQTFRQIIIIVDPIFKCGWISILLFFIFFYVGFFFVTIHKSVNRWTAEKISVLRFKTQFVDGKKEKWIRILKLSNWILWVLLSTSYFMTLESQKRNSTHNFNPMNSYTF